MNAQQSYRQLAAQGANLVSLVIQCYDQVIASLHTAVAAIEQKDIETKSQALKRAGVFISNLRNIVDFEHGGDTALYLDRFYALAMRKIIEGSFQLSATTLRELAQEFAAVRDAWQAQGAIPAPIEPPVTSPPSKTYPGYSETGYSEGGGWNA